MCCLEMPRVAKRRGGKWRDDYTMETQTEALKQNRKPKIEIKDQRSGRLGAKQIHKVQKQKHLCLGGEFSCRFSFDKKIDPMGYFPGGPVVKTLHFQCKDDWVCSLVG